jgi:hypothetical protein
MRRQATGGLRNWAANRRRFAQEHGGPRDDRFHVFDEEEDLGVDRALRFNCGHNPGAIRRSGKLKEPPYLVVIEDNGNGTVLAHAIAVFRQPVQDVPVPLHGDAIDPLLRPFRRGEALGERDTLPKQGCMEDDLVRDEPPGRSP